MNTQPIIAITTGEPAGIGPEISVAAAVQCATQFKPHGDVRIVLIGDANLLAARSAPMQWVPYQAQTKPPSGAIEILHLPVAVPSVPGQLDARNGAYVLRLIDCAISGCVSGEFAALVTAPVQKSTINAAGFPFTGHTEYLAEKTQTPQVVMMLAGAASSMQGKLFRVALATTHIALKDVPAALTPASLRETLRILDADLRQKFGIAQPRILVTGLNPHAGEGGYLGREEIEVITPVLEQARASGIDARGPYPADTLFQPRHLQDCDAVLAMYHDQGLPVLKYATFGQGVNITLGLPIIRTSVDHGTALDLAGTGKADAGSMLAAIEVAVEMVRSGKV